jgi:prepilin-type N-terminal cleavage/methylation domain-containing protein
MAARSRRQSVRAAVVSGFTLPELLVVIGLIALIIALFIPMLAIVQARGRDIRCQSNMRQVVQALFNYAAENRNSLPYGFYYERSDPITWEPSADDFGDEGRFICWASQVARYVSRGAPDVCDPKSLPDVLRCPEAEQVYSHPVSYAMNMVVGVSPFHELMMNDPPEAQLKPPTMSLLAGDTALLWDTAVQPGWENHTGFLIGLDIDGQRFWRGAISPQFRYRGLSDPYAQLAGGVYASSHDVILDVNGSRWKNIDPPQPATVPYQGNLRFRHRLQTACNVGFSDGSVRQFFVKTNSDKTARRVEAPRRNFMIKWPPGVPADETRPN